MNFCQPLWQFILLCCYFFTDVLAVPPDYCLSEVNTSDCGTSPKAVYYYYKPGSRCEIATWRGCPTYNVFANEDECSITCIFRVFNSVAEDSKHNDIDSNTPMPLNLSVESDQEPGKHKTISDSVEHHGSPETIEHDESSGSHESNETHSEHDHHNSSHESEEKKPNVCDVFLDDGNKTEKCTTERKQLYTYVGNETCVKFTWKGCPHPNLYNDEEACQMACNPHWSKKQLDKLNTTLLKVVEEIIDDVIETEREQEDSDEFIWDSCMEDPENSFATVEGCKPYNNYKP